MQFSEKEMDAQLGLPSLLPLNAVVAVLALGFLTLLHAQEGGSGSYPSSLNHIQANSASRIMSKTPKLPPPSSKHTYALLISNP